MTPNPQSFTPRDSWPPGTVIKDDYVIESRLGKGGFGTVYKARHRFLESEHVIKRLHEEYSSDEEYVSKFINEGQVIRRLKDCPYIVEVEHMTLTADQHLILIMEYMPGGDLNSLIQERRYFTINEVCGYIAQIAEGLRAAHAIELIHRDVKPHNVLLAANKRKAKLTDFGIAADHHNARATSVVRGGSLGYAAPEQWTTSGRNLDGRTDLYSLGVTMYQMLTGCMPYSAVDIGGWIDAVRNTQPSHVNRLREDVPEDLNRLVMQMIEVRREFRPPNVEAVVEALRPYAEASDWNKSSTLRVPDKTALPTQGTMPALTSAPPPPPPPSMQPPTFAPSNQPPPSSHPQTQYVPPSSLPNYSNPSYSNPSYSNPGYPPPPGQQPTPHAPTQFVPSQSLPTYSAPQTPSSYSQPPAQTQQPPPFYPQQQPPPQQNWTPATPPMMQQPGMQQMPPQPHQQSSGGAGKWLIIIPLLLALLGGGGWYGWKIYHPSPGPGPGPGPGPISEDPGKTDWIKKGEAAQARGDYKEALGFYRKDASGADHIPALQALVESDVEKKVEGFSNSGHFDDAEKLVADWLVEFPASERLQAQNQLIARRKAAQ